MITKKERLGPIVLASTTFLLFLIVFSSSVLVTDKGTALTFQDNYEEVIKNCDFRRNSR